MSILSICKPKPPSAKPLKTVKDNVLTVTVRDNRYFSWEVRDWSGNDLIYPWKSFYKWYFGRKGDSFIFRYAEGQTMIRRDDIVSFNVHLQERKVQDFL